MHSGVHKFLFLICSILKLNHRKTVYVPCDDDTRLQEHWIKLVIIWWWSQKTNLVVNFVELFCSCWWTECCHKVSPNWLISRKIYRWPGTAVGFLHSVVKYSVQLDSGMLLYVQKSHKSQIIQFTDSVTWYRHISTLIIACNNH